MIDLFYYLKKFIQDTKISTTALLHHGPSCVINNEQGKHYFKKKTVWVKILFFNLKKEELQEDKIYLNIDLFIHFFKLLLKDFRPEAFIGYLIAHKLVQQCCFFHYSFATPMTN